MEFNWRDYIELGADLGEQRTILSQALDQLSRIPEVREEIEKAHRLVTAYGAGQKIRLTTALFKPETVTDLLQMNGNFSSNPRGIIRLDPFSLTHAWYSTSEGEEAPLSLTGALIHELHHLANPNVWKEDMNVGYSDAVALQTVKAPGLTEAQRIQIFALAFAESVKANPPDAVVHGAIDRQKLYEPLAHLSGQTDLRHRIAAQLNLPPDSFAFSDMPAVLLHQIHLDLQPKEQRARLLNAEEAAVDFTDAIEAKYFNLEPRGRYSNGRIANRMFPLLVPDFQCSSSPWPKYQWQTVVTEHGTFTQPTIHAEPCEEALTPPPRNR